MYKLRHVYICDHCGVLEYPWVDMGGDLCIPSKWGAIGNKIHLCPKCYQAYLAFIEDGEDKYGE